MIDIDLVRCSKNIKRIKRVAYEGHALHDVNKIALSVCEQCLDCGYNPTIEDVITHETLHLVILKIENTNPYNFKTAYWMLDKLCYPKCHDGLGFGLTLKKFKRSRSE